MKALFLICTTLLCSSSSIANLIIENVMFDHRNDLRRFLNWTYEFSNVFEGQMYNAMVVLNQKEEADTSRDQNYVEQALSDLISSTAQLNNILVKGIMGYIINEKLVENVGILTTFIVTMTFVFDDLIYQISQWENDEHMLRKSITVMDEKPLKWFKEHGFDESTLNDISIQKLKEEVNKLYGVGKAFNRFVSLCGTLHKEIYNINSSTRLAWLLKFASNAEAVAHLEDYIRREVSTVTPSRLSMIIQTLQLLGTQESPLRAIFGNGKDDKLYPLLMPVIDRAMFFKEDSAIYWKMLNNICCVMHNDLSRLSRDLKWFRYLISTKLYWDHGFIYDKEKLSHISLENSVRDLHTGSHGITRRLERSVFNSSIRKKVTGKLSNGNMLYMSIPILRYNDKRVHTFEDLNRLTPYMPEYTLLRRQ